MKPQNAHAQEDRLLDFAYGELPVPEARLVEAHLQDCARCTQALDEIRGVRATMSQLSVEAAPDAGLESLMAYAQQAARRAAAGPAPKPNRWRRWLLPVVGLASVSTFGILTFQARAPELTRADLSAAQVSLATKESAPAPAAPAPTAAAPAAEPPAPASAVAQAMPAEAEMEGGGAFGGAAPSKRAKVAEPAGEARVRAEDWANAGSGGGLDPRIRRESASKAKLAPSASARGRAADMPAAAKPAPKLAEEASVDEEAYGLAERRVPDSQAPSLVPPRDSLRLGMPRPEARDDVSGAVPPPPPPPRKAESAPVSDAALYGAPASEADQEVAELEPPRPAPAPVEAKKAAPGAKAASRAPGASVAELSRQARAAFRAGNRAQEAGLIRAALAAGASGSQRWELLDQLCEAELALGMRAEAAAACHLVINEAPTSRAAGAARRRLAREAAPAEAPAQPGKPSK
ncbi:anti-sigma factor family protein [Myxococcus sp. Y35]|uniref:anti-sigma factor family protein n=1 Tax=Pseudomyxococcus flavus TaxID=3115648 RepID=UPI003CF0A0AB